MYQAMREDKNFKNNAMLMPFTAKTYAMNTPNTRSIMGSMERLNQHSDLRRK